MFFTTLQFGWRNLKVHKLRSLLTMLGVILGVGSVIAMLAVGEGSKQHAVDQIRELGTGNVIIRSVKPDQDRMDSGASTQGSTSRVLEYGLKYDDYERLIETLPTVERGVQLSLIRRNAQHGRHRIPNARILGTVPDYLEVKNLKLRRGRFLTDVDLKKTANVAVLGAGSASRLFSYEDPIGETVLLGTGAYRVIGILDTQASGTATPGAVGQQDFNNDIYIPLTAAQRRFGELQMIVRAGSRDYERTQLNEITLTVPDENYVSTTAAMAREILKRHHPKETDFEIQVPLELLRQAEREKRTWNLVLGSIAGISLLVGGVGIMNIMLATVIERTREIGIRRATGAKRSDITAQFLAETIVLSSIGGLLGVGFGISVAVAVTWGSEIETVLRWWAILLAFGISVSIGIVFGIYPARRAAMMDPIEALRHE